MDMVEPNIILLLFCISIKILYSFCFDCYLFLFIVYKCTYCLSLSIHHATRASLPPHLSCFMNLGRCVFQMRSGHHQKLQAKPLHITQMEEQSRNARPCSVRDLYWEYAEARLWRIRKHNSVWDWQTQSHNHDPRHCGQLPRSDCGRCGWPLGLEENPEILPRILHQVLWYRNIGSSPGEQKPRTKNLTKKKGWLYIFTFCPERVNLCNIY